MNAPAAVPMRFDTAQVHAGAVPDPTTRARVAPIHATTSFVFDDADHAAAIYALEDLSSFSYTRISNPTNALAERRINALEGGAGALLTSSGQAATVIALLSVLRTGDHLVASAMLYGGTVTLLDRRLVELAIETTYVEDIDDPEAWRAAIRPNTRAVFAETIGNPAVSVLDVELVAGVAHAHGVPLIVDNTLASPYLLRPLEHGADIVVHSTTKFLGGHGAVVGGAVVDGGRFDFGADPDRWPSLTLPEKGETQSMWDRFGPRLAMQVRFRSLMRDYGPAPSPLSTFLLLIGIETLSLRMRKHVGNARAVAAFLSAHPAVERVHHPELDDSPWRDTARRYLPEGCGSVLSFEVAGGLDVGKRVVEGLQLFSHLANVGDVRSLVIQPAATTHARLSVEHMRAARLTPGLIRLSVGIEDVDDILADLDQALSAATSAAPRIGDPQ